MSQDLRPVRVVGDLSGLPSGRIGPRGLIWWGSFGFMLLEGSGFLLAGGVYLYLGSSGQAWPPPGDQAPDLFWSGIFTAGLLLSQVPNLWVRSKAEASDPRAVRAGVLGMTIVGLALLAIRGVELGHLNVRWSHDAYGSAVWLLMILHTTHILTDLADTAVQSLWLFTHEIGDEQFSDVHDNADYWSFVVFVWPPVYALVYWAPRWL